MRIQNHKQALEDVAGEDRQDAVFVTWHAGRMVALATDGRAFMCCELKASEDELALGKQNQGTALRLAAGHWKLLRKTLEPFVFEPVEGAKWACKTMGGQTFPCELSQHDRLVEGMIWLLDRELEGRRTEISISLDAKLLVSLLRSLALTGESSFTMTKFEATDVLRIDPSSEEAHAVIGLMPMKYSHGIVGKCEVPDCGEQAWIVQKNKALCKAHCAARHSKNDGGGGTGQ